ncbi:MAG: hypothetical protein AB7V32_01075 [Candidatus Berkiella sp.]
MSVFLVSRFKIAFYFVIMLSFLIKGAREVMLSFANNVDTQTLLDNCNSLTKFTPYKESNNSLSVLKDGKIVVSTREITPGEFIALFNRLSLEQPEAFKDERNNAFAQEKMILIWHCSQLLVYLEKRLSQLNSAPKDNLLNYYDAAMNLQGFQQLCHQLFSKLQQLNQLMTDAENPHKKYWSTQFSLSQEILSKDLDDILKLSKRFISNIHDQRVNTLGVQEQGMAINVGRFNIDFAPTTRTVPKKFQVGSVNFAGFVLQVQAHFETYRDTWFSPAQYPFSGRIRVKLGHGLHNLHATMVLYAGRTYGADTELTQTSDNWSQDCPTTLLNNAYKKNPAGQVLLVPVVLRASFVEICEHVQPIEILPYLTTLVDIAICQHITEIAVLAPYNYSAVMRAFGFYHEKEDEHLPNCEQQMRIINSCFERRENIPFLDQEINRRTEDNKPILRSFHLSLLNISTRPVYLCRDGKKTTYEALLGKNGVIDRQTYPNGIIPEFHQIPLTFTQHISKLRARELTGRLNKPGINYGMSTVNYKRLDEDKSLREVAFCDLETAQSSQYTRMLTITRKQ